MDLRAERTRLEAALAAGDEAARVPLAVALQLCGEHAHAIAVVEPALATVREPRDEIAALIALGVARQMLGHPDAGVTYRSALARANAVLGKADPLTARAAWELGSMTGDVELVERAARIWIACAQPAWAIRARAFLAQLRGDPARELYAQALAALDLALGEHDARLVDVLLEAAAAFDPVPARSMRERAVRVARAATGPTSQRTIDALWALATTTGDPGVFDAARELARGDANAEAVLLHAKAAFLDRERTTEAGLRVREEALLLREQLAGIESPALIPLVGEIKQGWDELARPDEVEAFLRRCRARAHPASWVYRNLTYSIGYVLAAQGRRAEYASLWRELVATREAVCGVASAEAIEARAIAATELAGHAGEPPGADRDANRTAVGRRGLDESMIASRPVADGGRTAIGRPSLDDELPPAGPRGSDDELPPAGSPDDAPRAMLASARRGVAEAPPIERASPPEPAPAPYVPAAATGRMLAVGGDVEFLRVILARPTAALIADLRVTAPCVAGDYPRIASNAPALLAAIVEHPRPALRALALVQQATDDDTGLAWQDGCAHAPVAWPNLPRLERLHLGGEALVHAVAHPGLLELVLDDRPICPAGRWELPALHTLVWSAAADTELDLLDPLWEQPLPALRELVLRASFLDPDDALARPEIRDRIHTLARLTIPVSLLGDDPIDALLHHAAHLRHLATLTVTDLDARDARMPRLQRELPNLA